MKNYKFSLESVLEVRDNEEKNVLEDFVIAQNNLDTEDRKKEKFVKELQLCLEKGHCSVNIQELMMRNFYKTDLEDKIRVQEAIIEQKKAELEEVRKRLQVAQKDKKIMEKLKEKNLDEYKSDLLRKAQKEIDEFAVLRFKSS